MQLQPYLFRRRTQLEEAMQTRSGAHVAHTDSSTQTPSGPDVVSDPLTPLMHGILGAYK